MIKKICLGFFILILVIVTGCKDNRILKNDNITMSIEDGTLTKTSATIIITDLSNNINVYSEWFRIEKKENNKWKELKTKENGTWFNSANYYVDNNKKLKFEHSWDYLYGELEKGKYRLVKEVENKYFFVEFTID